MSIQLTGQPLVESTSTDPVENIEKPEPDVYNPFTARISDFRKMSWMDSRRVHDST